jgi:hypothetical protein
METLKARKSWSEVFWALNENNFNPRILYPAKYHSYKRFSKEFCTQKMKANKTMRGQAVPNHRRKDKESETNIDSAAHNQTLKQQKQLNDRNHHIHTYQY